MKGEFGILLPVFSLYGDYGTGTFGSPAYEFVDMLAECGVSVWEVLPLCPVDSCGSPYSSPCGTAFNPYFIDPYTLYQKGLIDKHDLSECTLGGNRVDYALLQKSRTHVLKKAASNYKGELRGSDHSLFFALKDVFGGAPWYEWGECADFSSNAVKEFAAKHTEEIRFYDFLQAEAAAEWQNLRAYANKMGVKVFGDLPFYVSHDSCEVWRNKELFALDGFKPTLVAGVPPDYFSENGQLWGNPVYNWQHGGIFEWWNGRISDALAMYDMLRLDHFRAFDEYYAIPYGRKDARVGEWKKGPGAEFFADKSGLPIVAEDLGIITPSVKELLSATGYPGMRVLQFGLNMADDNPHALKNIGKNCVCYTGTHDNAPLKAFIEQLSEHDRALLASAIGECDSDEATDRLLKMGSSSPAKLFVAPFIDILHKGEEYRINTPSTISGFNWTSRLCRSDFDGIKEKIIPLVELRK